MTILFAETHEWLKEEDGVYTMGISDHAQEELGDIVFVNLPEEGDEIEVDEEYADVESVKAVSGIFSLVSGEVTEINEELLDSPEKINEDAMGSWFVKLENVEEVKEGLMNEEEYKAFIQG